MKDERIQTTVNKFAAGGFFIWYVLTLISLNYRLFILKQHPRQFWDFFAIFLIANIFVFLAFANKGIFDLNFKRFWWSLGIYITILLFMLSFIKGEIHSVADGAMHLGGILLGLGPVIAIAYFLNRRWKRKEGLQDEK
jgi:hypothetical protein